MMLGPFSWELQAAFPLLGPLQLVPLLVAALLLRLGPVRAPGLLALVGGAMQLGLVGLALAQFDPHMPALQLAEHRVLLPHALVYQVAADGPALAVAGLLTGFVLAIVLVGTRGGGLGHTQLAWLFGWQGSALATLLAAHPTWFVVACAGQLIMLALWPRVWSAKPVGVLSGRFRQLMLGGLGLWVTVAVTLGARHLDTGLAARQAVVAHPGLSATSMASPGSAEGSSGRHPDAGPSSR